MAIRITDGSSVANLANVINEHDDSIVNHETRIDELEQGGESGGVISVNGESGIVVLDKSDIGLSLVNNTSDLDKPISTAQATVNTAKADLVAGKVPASQLPSYVDDVLEFTNLAAFPATGETGKIYIAIDTNREYRWSGSVYVQIVASPGTTDNVPEGTTNKYYTEDRVAAAPSVTNKVLQSVYDANKTATDLAIAGIQTYYQPETISYVTRVKTAGGILTATEIDAVDSFIVKGRNDGWLTLMKWVWCPMGNNLASSLVNLIAVSGVNQTLINNGFVEADYSKILGFGTGSGANTAKFLGTGIIPINQGLTRKNLSFGAYIPDDSSNGGTATQFLGTTPTSGNTPYYITSNPGFTIGQDGITLGQGKITVFAPSIGSVSYGPANEYYSYTNNVASDLSTGSPATLTDLDTEVTVFKANSTRFSAGRLSFVYMSSFLNQNQLKSLQDAIRDLSISIGRYDVSGGTGLWFGDSITFGSGATTRDTRWSTIVARNLGLKEFNTGKSSSQLRQNVVSGAYLGRAGGFQTYSEFSTVQASTAFIMYGTNDYITGDVAVGGTPSIIADYKSKLNTIVAYFKNRRIRVILVGIPWGTNTDVVKRNLYQTAMQEVAIAQGVRYVDNETVFTDTGNPSALTTDGVHPLDTGHALIAQNVINVTNGIMVRKPILDFPSIAANSFQELTLTFPTVTTSNSMAAPSGYAPLPGVIYENYISSTGVVTVRATNITAAAIDPASQKMTIQVNLV